MPDLKARQALPSGPELRSYPAKFEVRTLSGSQVELQGYATTYDEPYEMYDMFGPYTEVARSGMCSKTLAEGADVAYLANHEGLTLARTKTGSLRLSEDTTGLLTVATLNTARSDARDLVTAVEDGEIDQMSFAFRVMRQVWSPDFDQRDLLEVNLNRGDVSAVNYGANPLTSVGVQRSFRSLGASRMHKMAVELRAGKALSSQTMEVLSQVLDLIANADDAVDQAQPLLADLMGVENPDDEDQNSADDAERALAYLDVLRRQHEHETEASRLIVGF
jgi:HK97 family phage prohead protease